jgi:hypothetical protein
MTVTFANPCPLCGENASNYLIDADNYKSVRCTNCGDFEISTTAVKLLEECPEKKQPLLLKVKANKQEGALPLKLFFEFDDNGNPDVVTDKANSA